PRGGCPWVQAARAPRPAPSRPRQRHAPCRARTIGLQRTLSPATRSSHPRIAPREHREVAPHCHGAERAVWRRGSEPPIFSRMAPILTVERPLADIGRPFQIHSEFKPAGDQPQAIGELVDAIRKGERDQVLLGVTGSGKTFTMAHVIAELQRPALILAPHKTLAAQLYGEMKSFFPENAVEYFVSYYDYYQPEAYVPRTDTYVEKESSINEQIDRMRHSATRAILERRDTVIVASVS